MTRITPQTAAIQKAVLAIKDRLAEASIDEVVPHKELRALVPEDVSYLSHYVLAQRAQRLLNAESGAVFATVRGEGYRRLAHTVGADYVSQVALLRIRRQSRHGQKLATFAIEFANDANHEDKRRVYQKLATLGLVEHLTLRKSVKTMPPHSEVPQADPLAGLRQLLDKAAG